MVSGSIAYGCCLQLSTQPANLRQQRLHQRLKHLRPLLLVRQMPMPPLLPLLLLLLLLALLLGVLVQGCSSACCASHQAGHANSWQPMPVRCMPIVLPLLLIICQLA